MTPFQRRVLHIGVIATAVLARVWKGTESLFRSKEQVAQRTTGRFEAPQRKEMEVERLDRLRNPGNYRGR